MYSNVEFQNAIALTGPHVACRVTFGATVISYTDSLVSCSLELIAESFIGVFPSWKAKIIFIYSGDKPSYLNQECFIEMGAFNENHTVLTWIPMGNFTVSQNGQETDVILQQITLTAYDRAATFFDKKFSQAITFPITMKNFRLAYCAAVGIELDTLETLPLDDLVLNTLNISEGQEITYREIARQDAQANLAMAIITREGKLKLTCVFNSDPIEGGLNSNDYSTLKLENHYGPINSLVLARQATGDTQSYDDIILKNDASIAENGLCELKISNNIFLDLIREETIATLFPVADGFIYTPFEMELFARPDFDAGDFISLENMSGGSYPVPITSMTFNYNGGLLGAMKTPALPETLTKYPAIGPVQSIRNLEIRADRANQQILLTVSNVSAINNTINGSGGLNTRMQAAEQKLIPTAITQTVEDTSTLLAKKSYVDQTAGAFALAIGETIRDEYGNTISNVQGNFIFTSGGMEIKMTGAEFSTFYSANKIEFRQNGNVLQWLSGNKNYMTDLIIVGSLTLTYHKFESLPNRHTVFRYIGG